MSYGRRTTDRRRRVLYSSRNAENETVTPASRRAALRLREARSPLSPYGSRVRQRLRGRWFSLVPVRRRALMTWCAVVGTIVALLCAAHYASVTWPSIAYRPEIARALRLDRPDSFGRWVTATLLAGCAGISLLIYQLRRHKNDDYRGHYRLWRLVLVVMLLASVDSVASIVDWTGALLDAGFGKRVALSGNDWLRILLSVGGAVLALRLSVEVRRSRWALLTMLAAWCILAFPVAARWNFFEVDSIGRWTLVTSAPLLASAILFISIGGYLRMLFREVMNISDCRTIGQRLGDLKLRVFSSDDDAESYETKKTRREPAKQREVAEKSETPKRGWFGRSREPKVVEEPKRRQVIAEQKAQVPEESAKESKPPSENRGWFGRKKQTVASNEEKKDAQEKHVTHEKPKRGRFSLRLRPSENAPTDGAEDSAKPETQVSDGSEPSEEKPKKRFGLGSWMNGGKSKTETSTEADDESGQEDQSSSEINSPGPSDADNSIDSDGIDWTGMSKAERRRLRKKLKREGRAA